ncbi:MAG: LysE family translocator [Alphaproteobacteria bacterium]|nr:LysE family translocator [Alphaproteobacteria bacterium]
MTWDKYLWVGVYIFGFAMSPGPGTAAILVTSVRLGFWRGLILAAGEVCGDISYSSLVMFSLGAVRNYIESSMTWLQYICAIYLIWMGWRQYNSVPGQDVIETAPQNAAIPVKSESAAKLFMMGALISLTNPKVILFYASFLPLYVPLATVQLHEEFLVLAVIITSVMAGLTVITAFGGSLQKLNRDPFYGRLIARISGGIIILVGVFIAFGPYIKYLWHEMTHL